MKKRVYLTRVVAAVLVLSIMLSLTLSYKGITAKAFGTKEQNKAQDKSGNELGDYIFNSQVPDYKSYMDGFDNIYPEETIEILAENYTGYKEDDIEVKPELYEDYKGAAGYSLVTKENSLVEYQIQVKASGFYYLSFLYYPIEGKNSDIQRSIWIDGAVPYREMSLIEFHRLWTAKGLETYVDDNGVTVMNWQKDNQGNDLKPSSIEAPDWITSYCYDNNGYINAPLAVYLTEGEHSISILSLREPMLLHKIELKQIEEVPAYETRKAEWEKDGAKETLGQIVRVEAENAVVSSSQMLYPMQDQSSSLLYPSSPKELLNNIIGDYSWRDAGQWIEWKFEVQESGYYHISLFSKQNYLRGINVSRKIMIDGSVPFKELESYGFKFHSSWKDTVLSDDKNSPFLFYLEKGSHTIRMEVVLGELADIVGEVKDAVGKLNGIYRKVIRITGVAPDKYRDYQIESTLPELEGELIEVRDQLSEVIEKLHNLAGKKSDIDLVLRTMRDQLTQLIADQEDFIKVISSYKVNVRACGNWITEVVEQPLALDRIHIYSPDTKIEYENNSFWSKLLYEIKRLYYSFVIDYNMIGNVADKGDENVTLTLWVGTGRDQANIIKKLIDDDFTRNQTINVNLQLVDMSSLLKAELAGEGPDVAIQVWPTQTVISAANDTPVNYGIRNAVLDLTEFPDYKEVEKRFSKSAIVPYTYKDSVYGLPDTQTFLMMFYRKDILSEIGLSIPRTWEDVKVAMTLLAKNQMEFGLFPGEQVFAMLLYQMGGDYYNEEGTLSALDTEIAVNAFKEYCKFYTDYKLDKETSVEERFRTGESPIIIADYTLYNNLQVSAPDIEGLWGFTTVPGMKQEDGTINHKTGSIGLADMIMASTEYKEESWEFLKWWTSEETQVRFGLEMESLMGASARIATANLGALEKLAWPVQDYKELMKQFDQLEGIRQVPGGYYSWRNVNNAFYTVTTNTDTTMPREELMEKVIYINAEISYKLEELGLSDKKNTTK